jgi:hypothetical protein
VSDPFRRPRYVLEEVTDPVLARAVLLPLASIRKLDHRSFRDARPALWRELLAVKLSS